MFYMLFRSSGATDDGSAWEFIKRPDGYERVQVRPLTIHLLRDGARAFGVGGELVVDETLAEEIRRTWPDTASAMRSVNVVGPQPDMEQRPAMVQLVATANVLLASESIAVDADGRRSFHQPYVLQPREVSDASVLRIADNGVTLVCEALRALLANREPTLLFRSARFQNEPPLPDEVEMPEQRIPSADELRKFR